MSASLLATQAGAVSFASQVVRTGVVGGGANSALQALNVEALQVLKTKLTGGSSAAAASGASPHSANSSSSQQRTVASADPQSLTWLNFQRSLPPSGSAGTNPDVAAAKVLHSQFLATTAELCDDDRPSSALAETAGSVFRALTRQMTREQEATAVANAAAATTQSGADNYAAMADATTTAAPAPSAALLTQLKGIASDAKKDVEIAVGGRTKQVDLNRALALVKEITALRASMQSKYDQLRLLRVLKNLPEAPAAGSGTLYIPAPKDTSLPALPMLDGEFGSELPIMVDEEEETDSPEQAASDLASKPVRDTIRQLREQMSRMGLIASPQPSGTQAETSLLGLTPNAAPVRPSSSSGSSSSADSFSFGSSSDEYDSDESDLYVGESDDDNQEREQTRLAALSEQNVKVVTQPKSVRVQQAREANHPASTAGAGAGVEPLELPANPTAWWVWLVQQCDTLVSYNDAGMPVLSSSEIATQLLSILQSSLPAVQNELLDTIGFEGVELVGVLIKYRKELRAVTAQHQAQARQTPAQKAAALASETHKAKDGSVVRGLVGISIHSQAELDAAKNRKRADRRHARRSAAMQQEDDRYTIDEAKLDAQANQLKHMVHANAGNTMGGTQLPNGATRTMFKGWEEVYIPPKDKPEVDESQLRSIPDSFEPFAAQAFPRTKFLNRIQSKVYEQAYKHNNNLLICAPTGAGKTNIAMMCVLREIGAHITNGVLQKDMFKMVYVAPMKALAQEVQTTFQARLGPLGIVVKELTGDMQLTKKELSETQLIVTTPEKWDVISRKMGSDAGSGGSGLMALVKLLIIDEVHLLNEDRGPVLEILVARTLRLVESSQQMCRIVGLSATLPNYLDVGVFLKASPANGIFHFDASYRPVPLAQHFIGVTEKGFAAIAKMNEVCYKKVLDAMKQGQQVMVFVHSRRDTVKTANFMIDAARKENTLPFFDASENPAYSSSEKKIMKSRNSDLTQMWQYGFGIHHAGMVRPDRSAVEAAFAAGTIKVLCCTATLAWGVNLPAHTVIIKGTQIYNSEKGGFEDVGALDIQQIFGRAGRPQFQESGVAMLICEHEKLVRYLGLLMHQLPIESQFIKELPNHLNAEIILGTVTNLNEAVEWLSYTYLFTRMLRNPQAYGISYDELQFDELLIGHRQALIIDAAKTLMRCRMIKFEQKSGQFYSTDVGRVASHYYLHYESIELYNEMLQPVMTDEQILHLLASSKEFAQIKVRDEEVQELSKLQKKYVPYEIKGGLDSKTGKQNLLLQCYISNAIIDTPTLISDSYFIQQSAGRICRALFEMTLKRGKAYLAAKFLAFAKMIELKIWENQSPLRQFLSNGCSRDMKSGGPGSGGGQSGGLLKMPTIMRLEERHLKVDELVDMDAGEISGILKHNSMGHTVKQCLSMIPFLSCSASIQPITRTVLKIDIELTPEFVWHDRQHGAAESFYVWIEDMNNEHIYHSEQFLLHRKQMSDTQKLIYTIPIFEPLPPQYYIKIVSDRWLGSENTITLNFKHLILPEMYPANTALLDLHPLPRSALRNRAYEKMYEHKFQYFNPIQTQVFHTLYHTDENVLLGAPTGSGKTIIAELAMLRLFSMYPGRKVVYVAPLKALARERIEDWCGAKSFKGLLDKKVVELTGDTAPDQLAIIASDILIVTPEKWDGISRKWATLPYVKMVGLVIIDEIHLLGADRGPVLEVIVSRMRYISSHTALPIRIVGLSTALSNAKDLGDWLGIERAGLFNFPPSVRPVPLTIHISGHAGKHYCPRMSSMNPHVYRAIQLHSPSKPVLVFVSSRRQTRLTALDLIAFSAADGDPRKWLHMSEAALQSVIKQVQDPNLKHMISFGIGMHHAGLGSKDRQIVENLFLELKIRILVCTSTLAWGVNFPAHAVIVKGTEYYDAKVKRYVPYPITDVLQMIGRAGRPQFDSEAKAVVLVHEPLKNYYMQFLHSPFPVESSLLAQLHDHINAEICASGTIKCVSDFLDYLSWTFFFRRLLLNPSYYGLEGTSAAELNAYLSELVVRTLGDLERGGLILQEDATQGSKLIPLTLGKIASYYYLKYQTMGVFSERLKPESTVEQLLEVLANVKEFEELPVRHNEDKMNAELNSAMRWPVDTTAFDSPFVKTHMLLQSHFSRLDFPSQDYYTDLKSVLDQVIRVLQAMVDTLVEAGWLAAALHAMTLMQMIVQGRWDTDSTLANLPQVQGNEKLIQALRQAGWATLDKLAAADKVRVSQALRKAGCLSEKEEKEFLDYVGRMPVVRMQLASSIAGRKAKQPAGGATTSSSSSSSSSVAPSPSAASSVPTPLSSRSSLSFVSGSTFHVHVSLHRANANPLVRILTPVFSKPKDEAWWVVVGRADGPLTHSAASASPGPRDELVALKRVNSLKSRTHMTVPIELPRTVGAHTFTVYLVSDSYLGLDQHTKFEVHTTPDAHTPETGRNDTAGGTTNHEDDIYT